VVSSSAATIERSAFEGSRVRIQSLFFVLLVIATLIPFLFVPVAANFHADARSILLITSLLTFLGGDGHVGLTYFFYTDRKFREFFRSRRRRYYYVPFCLIIGSAFVYQYGSIAARAYLLLGYFAWQTYHYQRQNYGILSFVGVVTGTGRVHWSERAVLDLAVFSGILGLIRILGLGQDTFLSSYEDLLFQTGLNVLYLLPAVFISSLFFGRALRNKLRFGFLLLSVVFYVPTFIFSDPSSAIMGYALAHGMQYYVFMYFMGSNQTLLSRNIIRLMILVGACVLVGGALTQMRYAGVWGSYKNGIFGACLGFVMVHFVIDAGVWRLKEPFQRGYIQNSFAFLFTPPSEKDPAR